MNASAGPRYLEFVYTHLFERLRKGMLSDDEVQALENDLLTNPRDGDVVSGTGGVRKSRAAIEGRGKRGSVRVVYLYVEKWDTVFFIFPFAKNVQGNLTADQKKIIRTLVAQVTAEKWPRRKQKK